MKRGLLSDALLLAGIALVLIGTYQVYRPAAWILGGLALVAGGWFAALKDKQNSGDKA